tara:strand:+ start:1174 stop:1716 length:543 start_codon:yes stop_codon:yes gene_type:complete
MTNEEQGGHMLDEVTKLGGIIKGGTIQFGTKKLPFSAVIVSLIDNPETVMERVKAFEEAYEAAFGSQEAEVVQAEPFEDTETSTPIYNDGTPMETLGVGFNVSGKWPDGKPRVSCSTGCMNPKNPQYAANMFETDINGEFAWQLTNKGLDQNAYFCIGKFENGTKCANWVLTSHAKQLAN